MSTVVSPRDDSSHGSPLHRIASLAGRLVDAEVAALLAGDTSRPQLRATTGIRSASEPDLRAAARAMRPFLVNPEPGIVSRQMDRLGFCTGIRIPGKDGSISGLLLLVCPYPAVLEKEQIEHLMDLAILAGNEMEPERRGAVSSQSQERSKTQGQLLDKTLELAKFGEDLRQLHRLSTTNYETLDDLFADYLETGTAIFGLARGVVMQVRGRYAAVRAVRSESPSLRPGMTFELNQVYCGAVCEDRRTVACPSISAEERLASRAHYGPSRQSSYIGSPILVDGEIFGVLSFSSQHARWQPFSSHQIELVELMAKGIGRSILEGLMQISRQQAEALEQDRSQVLEMVAKDLPLDVVMHQIARMVERQSPALAAAVSGIAEGKLYCLAAPGMPELFRRRMQGAELSREKGCCLSAAVSRRIEVFETANPGCCPAGSRPGVHEYCWQACGAAPILSGSGEVLGLLTVYWKVAVQPRHVDSELLEMASSLAAIAMEHRRLTDRLAHQAQHDALTGLANRTLLTKALEERIVAARKMGAPLGVVFVDLDRFKQINDHLGHAAGDAVLKETAARLRTCLEEGEVAARLGGDEFVAVLSQSFDEELMRRRSREILEAVREPMTLGGQSVYVTASVGISVYPRDGESAEALLGAADLAMYRAKGSGRNDIQCFAPELEGGRLERLELEHSLRRALEEEQFQLYFQPIVSIRGEGSELDGFEALLGWNHPALGRISPVQFIPVAEECGMIGAIGEWALRQACRCAAGWQRRGFPPVRISVNVSPLQFARPDFVETVFSALLDSGLDGSYLVLEITESAIMENITTAGERLQRLRQIGVRVALDDFGTGYSSLGHLRYIPVDCLKVDRSFITEIDSSPAAFTLVQTIVGLAHNLSMTVVAEGVENERQLALLQGMNCDKVQGHWFGLSMPAREVEQWLRPALAIAGD